MNKDIVPINGGESGTIVLLTLQDKVYDSHHSG